LASDGAGDLFVADQSNHTIRKVVVSTGVVTTLAGSPGTSGSADGTGTAAGFNDPMGVAFDGEGNVFVADTENHTIRKIVVATGAVTTFAGSAGTSGSSDGTGTAARFNYPLDIASDKAGNLFVADTGNHTIRKIVIATQAVTTVVGVPEQNGVVLGTLPAGLASPAGLAFGPSGELLISDRLAQVILAAWF
jgi:sugar lactone lactonase YvrE